MMSFAQLIAFSSGFLCVSQEILWVRLIGFIFQGTPQAFGFVLSFFLLGIAFGAMLGKFFCSRNFDLLLVSGYLLILSGIVDTMLPWVTASASGLEKTWSIPIIASCVVFTSFFKSAVFPVVNQIGASGRTDDVGNYVSKIYFSNIIGSTLGPLITGFLIMHYIPLQQCLMSFALATLLLGTIMLCMSNVSYGRMVFAGTLALFIWVQTLPDTLVQKVIRNTGEVSGQLGSVIQNRYGIIHAITPPEGDDYVFGGNVYDGRINIDLMWDSNFISRIYALAMVHPKVERVLVIGMSAGSWTRVLQAFPHIKQIDVVEINPGYLELTSRYDETRPILQDSRVNLHFDDGRRWLGKNPGLKYDMIVMNTTWHWRAYITFLLSREFLLLARDHLAPEGVMAYNSTDLPDVFKTASTVFPEIYKYLNFVIAGDHIVVPEIEEGLNRLSLLESDGNPLVDVNDPRVREKCLNMLRTFEPLQQVQWDVKRPFEVITDSNMLPEYRYGKCSDFLWNYWRTR